MNDHDMIRRRDAIAALRSADLPFGYGHAAEVIRALPAAQVGVKPLEWVEIRPGQYFEARVIGILYSVRLGTDGIVRWQAGHMGTWHEAPTIEAAKAAAQADYDARIRSALTVQPSPDVAALVEALESIDQYGSDTLSGNSRGPDDRAWQREGVVEMVKRARAALDRLKGGAA